MKFFIRQHITWQDGSKSVKIFDINAELPITIAQVKESSRPKYALKNYEALTESVFIDDIEKKDDSQEVDNLKIDYFAKIDKKPKA